MIPGSFMPFSRNSVLPGQVGQNFAWLPCWVLPKRSFKASWSLFNYVYKSGLQYTMLEVISAFLKVPRFSKKQLIAGSEFLISREKSTWRTQNVFTWKIHVNYQKFSRSKTHVKQETFVSHSTNWRKIRQKKKDFCPRPLLKIFQCCKTD